MLLLLEGIGEEQLLRMMLCFDPRGSVQPALLEEDEFCGPEARLCGAHLPVPQAQPHL